MRRICVFAGSRPGRDPQFMEAARELGEELAAKKLELVYGGSQVGLMGRMADTVLERGGKVTGVMPTELFDREVAHHQVTQLIEVRNMHERKGKMGELADAFIALPGGYGTLEEVFEVVSWGHLGLHHKPIGLLNIGGFYNPLIHMVQKIVDAGFIPERSSRLLLSEERPSKLLARLQQAGSSGNEC
ncbi:MAG: TIGR00730 family Rossman fold protein [Firmicutes bacterium]|nr:TIGR00730 family Rossman fold protein [Bacillota bacterium]